MYLRVPLVTRGTITHVVLALQLTIPPRIRFLIVISPVDISFLVDRFNHGCLFMQGEHHGQPVVILHSEIWVRMVQPAAPLGIFLSAELEDFFQIRQVIDPISVKEMPLWGEKKLGRNLCCKKQTIRNIEEIGLSCSICRANAERRYSITCCKSTKRSLVKDFLGYVP